MEKLKVFSVFSGAARLDSTFMEDDNFEVVGFSENDKWASSLLEFQHPNINNYGDITKSQSWDIPKMDVLIGGFSCQGFSTQGKQTGLEHLKSGLFNFIPSLIKRAKPKYVLLENVTGLLMKNMEEDFEHIKKSIKAEGYSFSYRVQDSSFYGTAQQRCRVFILCVREDINQIGESDSLYERSKQSKIKAPKGIEIISFSKSTRNKHTDYRYRTDGLINTLTTGVGCQGASTGTMVVEGKKVRKLSPIECEKLQCWPKDWTKFGIIGGLKVNIPNNQRWKIIGNGVCSPVVVPFKEEILMMENL